MWFLIFKGPKPIKIPLFDAYIANLYSCMLSLVFPHRCKKKVAATLATM